MALKTFKPYTKSTRGTILVDRTGLWKGKPFKTLVSPKNAIKVEIITVILPLLIELVDIKKCTDMWIFTEKNSTCKPQLKELNMILIDHATSC